MSIVQFVLLFLPWLLVADLVSDLERFAALRAIGGTPFVFAGLVISAVLVAVGRRRFRDPLGKLTLLTATGLLLLAAGEMAFRATLVQSRIPTDDESFARAIERKWPRPIDAERDTSTFRILGLADSFGSFGAHENYHHRLETILRARGWAVEVVNVSLAAWEPRDELIMLRYALPRYRPDLVLNGFYVVNDFNTPDSDPVMSTRIVYRLRGGLAGLRPRELALVKWLRRLIVARRNRAQVAEEGLTDQPVWTHSRRLLERTAVGRVRLYDEQTAPVLDAGETWATLDSIRETAERAGARYVLLLHPDRFQIEDSLRADVVSRGASRTLDLEIPQRGVRAYAYERGVRLLDLYPVFRREGVSGGLYAFRNTHYSTEGNERAAELVADFLVRNALIPERFRQVVAPPQELPEPAVQP